MGKSAPQTPTPVDPTVVAQAQTASNEQTANYQSNLNNANSVTPYGTVTQTQNPTTNQWTSTTTLSPAEQAIFNQSTQAQSSAQGIANSQLGNVSNALQQQLTPGQPQTNVAQNPLATSFDPGAPVQTSYGSGGQIQTGFNQGQGVQGQINTPSTQQAVNQAEQASFGSAMNLLQPQMQQASEQQQAQLAAQGLNPNDAAYQNSQTLFNNSQTTQLQQAANAAVAAGQGEQNTLFGQAATQGQFANSAAAQEYAQNQGQAAFANSAQQQQNIQNQQAATFGNTAAAQQYNQNQGLAAFQNTAAGQQFSQGQSNAQLANAAEGQLFNQQAAAQEQPINEFTALMGSGQVQAPQGTGFNTASVAPTDVTGAYALQAQQQQNAYQAQQANYQSGLGGLYSLGSAALAFA